MKIHYLFICILMASCTAETESSTLSKAEVNDEQAEPEKQNEELPSLESGEYFFSGAINRTFPFHMHLMVNKDRVNGWYYYDKHRKEITLEGSIENGKLMLAEKYKDKVTGNFYSTVLTPDSISGDWKSPKGTEIPFVLTSSDRDEYNFVLEKLERTWTDQEFKSFAGHFKEITLPYTFNPVRGSESNEEDQSFTTEDVQRFINPGYNPEEDFEYNYFYAGRYDTEKYIALFFYQSYYPGAFGIDNKHVVLRTYTLNGDLIDEKYLACDCLDRNYYDYDYTAETVVFNGTTLRVKGVQGSESLEGAEEAGMPVFEEEKEVSYSYSISPEGKVK